MRVGIVGGPMAGMEVRIVDWEEGNYRLTDKVTTTPVTTTIPPLGARLIG